MYISNKPPAPRPTGTGAADGDAAVAANADPASPRRPGPPESHSPPPDVVLHIHASSPSSSSSSTSQKAPAGPPSAPPPARTPASLPVSLPPILFQRSKLPSASIAPSTAEGRPVPVTDPAGAHHSSALQKLNSKYPSAVRRQGYNPEASSAQSSTYSQPVLVRTYSGPPSQGSRSTRSRHYRPPSSSRGLSRRVPLPSASTPGGGGPGRPIQPTVSGVGVGTTSSSSAGTDSNGAEAHDDDAYRVSMSHPYKAKKAARSTGSRLPGLPLPLPWPFHSRQEPEEPKLPPLEAFSFKSFMADLEARGDDNGIGADLDRIAEICARSRYSLSNQYEVHVAPHGSGSSFVSGQPPPSAPRKKGHARGRSHGHGASGPTLQAITSDDESLARSHYRRRNAARRRSAAYGTLETIMSSSRSSEEDMAKKKSASELVGEVRGRAARKAWADQPSGSGSAETSTGNSGSRASPPTEGQEPRSTAAEASRLARKKSASFASAIMDTAGSASERSATGKSHHSKSSRTRTKSTKQAAPSALLSQPAEPQTSGSHLGVRTAPRAEHRNPAGRQRSGKGGPAHPDSWAAWIPWRTGTGGTAGAGPVESRGGARSQAEGSLRQLLGEGGDGVARG